MGYVLLQTINEPEFYKRNGNDIWQNLVDQFLFKDMFPAVVAVDRDVVNSTPFFVRKTLSFLLGEGVSPFVKLGLVKFLFSIHEMTSCVKSSMNRTIRTTELVVAGYYLKNAV